MMTSDRIVALIPSLRGSLEHLRRLTDGLSAAGADPFVVPTSVTLAVALQDSDIPHLTIGANPGFGASLTRAVAQVGGWDWMMPVNDDVTVDGDALRQELQLAQGGREVERLVYLDPGQPKPIPSAARTFAQISLIEPAFRRFRPARAARPPYDSQHVFRPFSIALISNRLWQNLNGFDDRLVYTFEDADFGRRAAAAGAEILFPDVPGILHLSSSTSRRHMDVVLPVAVWSAYGYLQVLGASPLRARGVLITALLARMALIPFTKLPIGPHLRGVASSIESLVAGRQPSLAHYETT